MRKLTTKQKEMRDALYADENFFVVNTIAYRHNILEAALAEAYSAATRSEDPSTQNGALIYEKEFAESGVFDKLATVANSGYNRLVYQNSTTINFDVLSREDKYKYVICAERDAIFNYIRQTGTFSLGNPINQCILVCPWICCPECAKVIVGTGIKSVWCHFDRLLMTPDRSIECIWDGIDILTANGINITALYGPVRTEEKIKIRIDGKTIAVEDIVISQKD